MSEITLNSGNFEKEVLNSPIPVLVDFWAVWCGPCRAVAPVIEELAKEYEGKIKVGKVNVDENNELASRYGVMSIPTMKYFKDGKIVNEIIGAAPKAQFEEAIKKLV
ncbi:MAG: thioredoxin [Patescibacteria group bacterium]|nr:thioredoxin [Patescibacteria group bacterium]